MWVQGAVLQMDIMNVRLYFEACAQNYNILIWNWSAAFVHKFAAG
jgi:hypothetical protein